MVSGATVRAIVADDAVVWREGVTRLLASSGIDVVGEAGDAQQLTELADRERPDVAVIDVRMPPTLTDDGLRAALWIRRSLPGVGVLVLCQAVHSGPAVSLLGVGEGGVGYLLKDRVSDAAQLVDAVVTVAAGGSVIDPLVSERLLARRPEGSPLSDLTERELAVLRLLAEGHSNQGIADTMFVSLKTVETHMRTMLMKLDLHELEGGNRRVHAVLAYLRETAGHQPL